MLQTFQTMIKVFLGRGSIVSDAVGVDGQDACLRDQPGTADVPVGISLAATLGFFVVCLGVVAWIFRTGYRLKS